MLQPDAPLEADREQGVEEQVAVEIERLPALIAGDPDDAVAHIVVHAEDVGVLVVHEVVGEPPVLGRPAHVPLPRRGVDLGIVHPIPLAVHDVVADLHVLDDLGDAQRHGACPPCRAFRARGQHQAACYLEGTLGGDGAADVARVARAPRVFDVLADGVQLDSQALDVGVGQMRERRNVSDCHRVPPLDYYATVTYGTVGYQSVKSRCPAHNRQTLRKCMSEPGFRVRVRCPIRRSRT